MLQNRFVCVEGHTVEDSKRIIPFPNSNSTYFLKFTTNFLSNLNYFQLQKYSNFRFQFLMLYMLIYVSLLFSSFLSSVVQNPLAYLYSLWPTGAFRTSCPAKQIRFMARLSSLEPLTPETCVSNLTISAKPQPPLLPPPYQ